MSDHTYAELHLHTYYSFQDGAASIGELVAQASKLGYKALAITDHDNLCGAMEFSQACRDVGIQPVNGCEVTLIGVAYLSPRPPLRLGEGAGGRGPR